MFTELWFHVSNMGQCQTLMLRHSLICCVSFKVQVVFRWEIKSQTWKWWNTNMTNSWSSGYNFPDLCNNSTLCHHFFVYDLQANTPSQLGQSQSRASGFVKPPPTNRAWLCWLSTTLTTCFCSSTTYLRRKNRQRQTSSTSRPCWM